MSCCYTHSSKIQILILQSIAHASIYFSQITFYSLRMISVAQDEYCEALVEYHRTVAEHSLIPAEASHHPAALAAFYAVAEVVQHNPDLSQDYKRVIVVANRSVEQRTQSFDTIRRLHQQINIDLHTAGVIDDVSFEDRQFDLDNDGRMRFFGRQFFSIFKEVIPIHLGYNVDRFLGVQDKRFHDLTDLNDDMLLNLYGYAENRLAKYREDFPELVDDVIEEAFERLLRYRNNFRGDSSVKSWFDEILRNRMKTEIGHNGRYYAYHVELTEDTTNMYDASADDPSDLAISACDAEAAISFLTEDVLSDADIELLKCVADGFSSAETAKVMELTETAAKVRLHRLRKRIAKVVTEGYPFLLAE